MIPIVLLTPGHPPALFEQVAQIHAAQIHHGLLPQLGLTFLTRLYKAVAATPQGILYIALKDAQVVGFIAGSADLRLMYLHILVKQGGPLLWCALPYLRTSAIMAKVWRVALYPAPRPSVTLADRVPIPELLAMAVAPAWRRHGVGARLLRHLEDGLRAAGPNKCYRVATNTVEAASNAFYQKHGFSVAGTQRHNDLTLRVYTKTFSALDPAAKDNP